MELALRGILIGLSLGAPIGPINIEIVRRSLRSGFLSGWLVGAGAITADTLYCILVIIGIEPVVDRALVRTVLWLAGASFLGFIAYNSLRSVRAERLLEGQQRITERRSFATGFLMALFNPMGIVFWLSIGGALVASGVEQSDSHGGLGIVIGVILGLGLWVTTLSTLVHGGRRFVSDNVFRLINVSSSVLLLGFSVWFLVQAVREVT